MELELSELLAVGLQPSMDEGWRGWHYRYMQGWVELLREYVGVEEYGCWWADCSFLKE